MRRDANNKVEYNTKHKTTASEKNRKKGRPGSCCFASCQAQSHIFSFSDTRRRNGIFRMPISFLSFLIFRNSTMVRPFCSFWVFMVPYLWTALQAAAKQMTNGPEGQNSQWKRCMNEKVRENGNLIEEMKAKAKRQRGGVHWQEPRARPQMIGVNRLEER